MDQKQFTHKMCAYAITSVIWLFAIINYPIVVLIVFSGYILYEAIDAIRQCLNRKEDSNDL